MKLFAYHFRKKLWLFPAMGIYVIFLVLLDPHMNFFAYHESAETFMSLWVALFSAFVLTSEAETEFTVCYGTPLWQVGFAQWMPHLLYPLFIAFLACPLYWRFHDFGNVGERAFASSAAQYSVLFFSFFVTFFFLSALMFFLRMLWRNLYVSFAAFMVFYFPFYQFHRSLSLGAHPVSFAKYDVWITGFLLEERFGVTREMWLTNRYCYLGIACILAFLSFLLLKQKYYKNI